MRIVLFLSLALLFPSLAQAGCANQQESQALNLRALDSSLMVAALSCGQQAEYNQFIRKNQAMFISGGGQVKSYFRRSYGGNSETELNRFITRLANDASKSSMQQQSDAYCAQMKDKTFPRIASLKQRDVYKLAASKKYTSLHGIRPCAVGSASAELSLNDKKQH